MNNTVPSLRLRHLFALLPLLAGFPAAARAEVQTLTDNQGRSIKADVISVTGDQVKIRRDDGQVFNLSLATLGNDDQKRLKDWAAAEAAKPLAPGAIQMELSRGCFKTDRKKVDVKLTTGETVKDGETLTEEKWGYSTMLANRTSQPLDNLRAEYLLFATIDNIHSKEKQQGFKKKRYQTPIDTIPPLSQTTFRTETITAVKSAFNGNIIATGSGRSSSGETLSGIWMRVYRGDQLVLETSMPDSLRMTEKW